MRSLERLETRAYHPWEGAFFFLGAAVFYALAFVWLYPRVGLGTMALASVPVGLASWIYGSRGGLLSGLLTLPFHFLLLTQMKEPAPAPMYREGVLGSIALAAMGIFAGWLRDRAKQLRFEVAQRKQAEERRAMVLSTLLEASKAISSTLELEEVLLIIARQLVKAIGVYGCTLSRWDREADSVVTWIEWNRLGNKFTDVAGSSYPLDEYPTTRAVLEEGRPIAVLASDPSADPAERALMQAYDSTSLLMLPLAVGDRVIGLVELDENARERVFSPADIRLSQALADQAAIAIENAFLFEKAQLEISQRKQAEQQLLHDAFHDTLTGLPNAALLKDRMRQAIRRAKRRQGYTFAVLYLDIDCFRNINDSLGRSIGDQLLIAIARRFEGCLRPGDTVARLGGDEFAILLDDVRDARDATRIAERVKVQLDRPFKLGSLEVFLTASLGIALSGPGLAEPEELVRDANFAMSRAKALGRARHELFDAAMHSEAVARLKLENDLRRAIERQEFSIHFQPVVWLETGEVSGFEALVRWQHPDRGLLPPAEFIPVAEEAGLIIPIDRWVLRRACQQLCQWLELPSSKSSLTVSVNLSGLQFSQPDLVDQVDRVLRETGLDPSGLRLEVTESALMENSEAAIATLAKLRDLRVQIHIDDFGTGYSSLSYLHQFPVDTLKIPHSFVNRIDTEADNAEIVRTIVTLARNLGMGVIAEGVETAQQVAQLSALGCEKAQGFYFSRPLDATDLEAMVCKDPPWQELFQPRHETQAGSPSRSAQAST